MNEPEAISTFLAAPSLSQKPLRLSCFWAALRDARGASGRHVDSGEFDPQRDPSTKQIWLGALGYLVLIDLLGHALRSATGPTYEKPYFTYALRAFLPSATPLGQNDFDTLLALRSSFAHRYSVVNTWANPSLNHIFRMFDDDAMPLITAGNGWDGTFNNTGRHVETKVNLRRLAELVESMVRHVGEMQSRRELRIVPRTVEEFCLRYMLIVE